MGKERVGEFLLGATRKIVGRVLKTSVRPESYDLASHAKEVRKAGLRKVIRAARKNKNIYKPSYPGRETVWSAATGQKVSKNLRKTEREAIEVFTDKKGKITHFGLKPGSKAMDEVAINVAQQKGIVTDKLLKNVKRTVETTKNHSIMGGYNLKVPAKGKGAATYQDTWDFAVNKGENLNHYIAADKLDKAIKPNKATKAIDRMISYTNKFKRQTGHSPIIDKVQSGLETAKVIAQPETTGKIVNKARNVADKFVKKYEIKGELVAPKGAKVFTKADEIKHVKKYMNLYKKDKIGKGQAELPFMYDKLLRSGAMKPYEKATQAAKPVIKDIKKGKFFGMPNSPKKLIQDIKETKWEHRRSVNTLAKKKIVKQTKQQYNRAIGNAVIAGTQVGVTAGAAGVGINAIIPNKSKKKK